MPDRRREPAGSARAGRHRLGRPEQRPLRADIEGLRAVAVGLVIMYHIGLSYLPGGFVGVDVFFVISAFLITTQLVSELNRDGRMSLPEFYAKRAKRLLPAAGPVPFAVHLEVYFFVPHANWSANGGDIAG